MSAHDRQVLLSSKSNEAYTPPFIVDAGRQAMGGIDLDPFSCATANEEVRATRYFDGITSNGFISPYGTREQPSRVWCNPPGGYLDLETMRQAKRGASSAACAWVALREEYLAGRVMSACFYCFRLDMLQTVQADDGPPPHAFPFVIFGERPRHWDANTPKARRGYVGQPTHACAVFFLPERGAGYVTSKYPTSPGWAKAESIKAFVKAFSPWGFVRE